MNVALRCFTGEFDEVINAMPRLDKGLVIDAGGYIGAAAIIFAKAYPDAHIITIEPSKENFEILKRNVAPYPNITALNKALSAERGIIELKDRGTGPWGFTIVPAVADRQTEVINSVECITVDDVLLMANRTGIDIFKIDIEGGEHKLFSADTRWVNSTGAIYIELHDRIISGCTDLFAKATSARRNIKLGGDLGGEKFLSLAG